MRNLNEGECWVVVALIFALMVGFGFWSHNQTKAEESKAKAAAIESMSGRPVDEVKRVIESWNGPVPTMSEKRAEFYKYLNKTTWMSRDEIEQVVQACYKDEDINKAKGREK